MKDNKNRILAYSKAKELSLNEMAAIAGGSAKLTCEKTGGFTGAYLGQLDGEFDQIWD